MYIHTYVFLKLVRQCSAYLSGDDEDDVVSSSHDDDDDEHDPDRLLASGPCKKFFLFGCGFGMLRVPFGLAVCTVGSTETCDMVGDDGEDAGFSVKA